MESPKGEQRLRSNSVLLDKTPLPQHTKSKFAEYLDWAARFTMRGFFKDFGCFIGMFPGPCLLTVTTAIVLSGLFLGHSGIKGEVKLRDRVRDGYTPRDSRAYVESKALREFSGLQGDPMMTTVILRSRDNSSMIEESNLLEAVRVYQFLKKNLSVAVNESDPLSPRRSYTSFCGKHCQQNDVLDYFALELHNLRANTSLFQSNLSYPQASLMGEKVALDRNFFQVTTSYDPSRPYTNMEHVGLIALSFTADISFPHEEELVSRWEISVFDFASSRSINEPIEVLVIGAEIVDREMNKDSQRMTPYFIVGFISSLLFILFSAWFSFFLYNKVHVKKMNCGTITMRGFLPILVCFVPGFAILTTFSIFVVLGWRINSLMLIMPFLIMGIGVNDSFLVVHHWQRAPSTTHRIELMGLIFEDVGPSITMTTFTNVISFAIGAFLPTDEIALFCSGCAIAMALAYVYTILFFGPVLALMSPEHGVDDVKGSKTQKKILTFFSKLLDLYATLLQTKFFRILCLLIWLVYITIGLIGAFRINSKLETEKILPLDSPIRLPNRIVEEQVWSKYYPVLVMVNSPFEMKDKEELMKMVHEFEALPGSKGVNGTIFWLRDYEKYFDFVADSSVDDVFGDGEESSIQKGAYDMTQLQGFLGSPQYKYYSGMVNVNYTKSPPISKFSMLFSYANYTSWADRILIQQQWREVVDRYPSVNASIWNVNGMFVDQMLSLKQLALWTILLTLACMAAVCLCFIQKLIAVIIATLSIASIAAGTIGYLGVWELDLDPVTICAILIAIGMSVDFTAHISLYYVNCPRPSRLPPSPHQRLTYAIGAVLWPAIQSNASTLICVLPLIALQNYIPLVFVKTLTLVVIIGTCHGLLLIPMLLSVLPEQCIEWDLLKRDKVEEREEGKEMEERKRIVESTDSPADTPLALQNECSSLLA